MPHAYAFDATISSGIKDRGTGDQECRHSVLWEVATPGVGEASDIQGDAHPTNVQREIFQDGDPHHHAITSRHGQLALHNLDWGAQAHALGDWRHKADDRDSTTWRLVASPPILPG